MSEAPIVLVLHMHDKDGDEWRVHRHDPKAAEPEEEKVAYLDGQRLGEAIYDWTQSGFFGDLECDVPIGSTIVVHLEHGLAVVVLYSAWPVLVAGKMAGDEELHRFRE